MLSCSARAVDASLSKADLDKPRKPPGSRAKGLKTTST
jgi:hypothetical protein